MTQQAFNLRAAGYDEPPHTASYPFIPVHSLDILIQRAGGVAWLRSMTDIHGHNGH